MIHKKIGGMCLALLLVIVGLGLVGCDDPMTKKAREIATETTIGSPESRGFVKINENQYLVGGDMVFDVRDEMHRRFLFGEVNNSRGMFHLANSIWPEGKVYYAFTTTPGFIPDPDEKEEITDAMRFIENTIPGISFNEVPLGSRWEVCLISEKPSLVPMGVAWPGRSIFSYMELRDFGQWTIRHELLHVLGLYHEQERPERDTYVNVSDPLKFESIDTNRFGTPFDFDSIMLYPNPYVSVKPAYQEYASLLIGFQPNLSLNDIYTIQRLYGLIPPNTPAPPVTTTIYVPPTTTTTLPNLPPIFPTHTISGLGTSSYTVDPATQSGSASINGDGRIHFNFNVPQGYTIRLWANVQVTPGTQGSHGIGYPGGFVMRNTNVPEPVDVTFTVWNPNSVFIACDVQTISVTNLHFYVVSTVPPTTTTTTVWVQTPISLTYDNGSTSNGSYSASTGTAWVVATSGSMSAIVNYPLNRSSYRITGNIQVLGAGQNGSISVGGATIAIATTAPQTAQAFSYTWTGNQQVKINSVYPSGTGVCKVTNLKLSSPFGSSETLVAQVNFPTGNTIQGYYTSGVMPGSYTVLNMVSQGSSTVTFTLPQRYTYIVVGDLSLTMPSDQTNGIFTAGGTAIYATSTPQKVAFEWSGSNIATLAMSGIGSGAVRLQNVTFYGR